MNSRFEIILVFLLFSVLQAKSQKSIHAIRVENGPKIDGFLDDSAWSKASEISDFIQRLPDTNQPVSQKTVVYVCYTDREIYFGFRCFDDPNKITAKELKRDISLGEDDRVQVILDTYLDKRNAFWFQIGPRGSIGDALISENGAVFNKDWDGLFEGKARIHDQGWDAEIAIPFKTLRFKPGETQWGLKLIRHIRRRLESSYWPEANLNSYLFQVSDAGLLTGIENISQGFGMDVRPYFLVGMNHHSGEKNKSVIQLGGDIFYQVSTGLNAALTINTDFAQTEVDSRQINLTRFELFFPEKRNFFLDGSYYFNFGFRGDDQNPFSGRMIPYFSRRIGLDNEGRPIPIIEGLKLAGRVGNWNIGVLNITDKTEDSYRNFSVMRVSKNFNKQSYIGMIATRGDASSLSENWLGGIDFKIATSKLYKNKNLALTGFALKSNTTGLAGKDFSFGGDISYPNDLISCRLGHQTIEENYRAGTGFVPRTGIHDTYSYFYIGPRPNKYGIMKITTGGIIDYITDMKGQLLTRDISIKIPGIDFLSGESLEYSIEDSFEFLDKDFNIYPRDSISIPSGNYNFQRQKIIASSAKRRKLWISLTSNWGGFYNGKRTDFIISSGWKINIPFYVGAEFIQNNVRLPEGNFTTHIYRINADIYFNPEISLSNFIQYDNFSDSWGWQSRFRWIIKPGNEVIFVWNSIMTMIESYDRYVMQENTSRIKLNYTIRF